MSSGLDVISAVLALSAMGQCERTELHGLLRVLPLEQPDSASGSDYWGRVLCAARVGGLSASGRIGYK